MENTNVDYKNIPGWGIDADPRNEPTYPMKNYTGDDHRRLDWERPTLQPVETEILVSVERPYMPAVFGTPLPPKGLSGVLRRAAFKFTESEYGHWLNLLLADRINVIEGIVDDIKKGHFPNILAERGMKADWEHNRKEVVTKVAVAVGVGIAIAFLVSKRRQARKADVWDE